MLAFDGKYPAVQPKAKFWRFLLKNCKKSSVKHSTEKPILLNFVNLSPTFCPRFQDCSSITKKNYPQIMYRIFSDNSSAYLQIYLWARKFYIRRNNNKVDSIETGHILIADLLPRSDLEKYMYTTIF